MDPKALEAYIRGLERQIERHRDSVALLEKGSRMQQRWGTEPWRDVTAQVMQTHKSGILELESIIAALRKGEVP